MTQFLYCMVIFYRGADYEIPVVVTAVEENSPAKNAGLKQGDIVEEVLFLDPTIDLFLSLGIN